VSHAPKEKKAWAVDCVPNANCSKAPLNWKKKKPPPHRRGVTPAIPRSVFNITSMRWHWETSGCTTTVVEEAHPPMTAWCAPAAAMILIARIAQTPLMKGSRDMLDGARHAI